MSGGGCSWIERDEIFEQYVRGTLGPEDRDAFEAHYFECDACFDRLHASHELRVALAALPPDAQARRPARAWSWRWVAVPLAATLVVAVSAALWSRNPVLPASPAVVTDAPSATVPVTAPATPLPEGRAAARAAGTSATAPLPQATGSSTRAAVRNAPAAVSTVVLISPSDNETLPLGGPGFAWRRVPGAVYYDLHIVTEEGNVVWSGKAEGTSIKLPAGHWLQAGQKYFVWVRAHLSGGGTIKSPAVPFHTSGQ